MLYDGLTFLLGVLCLFSLRSLLDLELHPPLWFPMSNDWMIRDSWLLTTCGSSLVLDQVVVQSLFSSSFSKVNSVKPKVLAEVSIETWSSEANVTSGEWRWASLSWVSHLRDVILEVAPSPRVQVGWLRNLFEQLNEKYPAKELMTSRGNRLGKSSEVELSR